MAPTRSLLCVCSCCAPWSVPDADSCRPENLSLCSCTGRQGSPWFPCCVPLHWNCVASRAAAQATEFAAAVLVDMNADDLVERALGLEAERQRARRRSGAASRRRCARSARRLAADARRDLVAGDPAQRLDLLADRAADARHGQVDARPELVARQARRHGRGSRSRRAGWRGCARTSRRPAAPPRGRPAARG